MKALYNITPFKREGEIVAPTLALQLFADNRVSTSRAVLCCNWNLCHQGSMLLTLVTSLEQTGSSEMRIVIYGHIAAPWSSSAMRNTLNTVFIQLFCQSATTDVRVSKVFSSEINLLKTQDVFSLSVRGLGIKSWLLLFPSHLNDDTTK